jgi:hypothetical protein
MIGSIALIYVLNASLTVTSDNIMLWFARDNSLLIIIASLTCFYLFSRLGFTSVRINRLAGYVFPVYLLQSFLIRCLSPYYISAVDSNALVLYFGMVLLVVSLSGFIIEWMRRIIFGKVENTVEVALSLAVEKIVKRLQLV